MAYAKGGKASDGEPDMDPLPPMKKVPDADDGENDMDAPEPMSKKAMSVSKKSDDGEPDFKKGGIAKAAGGGAMSFSQEVPWFERHEENSHAGSGFLNSPVAGRTDRLPVNVAADSYVIPADVMSGLGQGNSLAGARIIDEALRTGPWGTSAPRTSMAHGDIPHAPKAPSENDARGGHTHHMPIMVAGGEHIVDPEAVERLGRAKLKDKNNISRKEALSAGHRCLDEMVARVRTHTVKTIKSLPKPKK